ncbi:TetR/AcrR family transcriptional regulator C-terminal domain-containing protein [Levilactobacillus brevis]|uniref:TetR/AcrR family transcriptional regulator C-terminal domain-containing protein n=1 Tax=Levilactobacillus brevis TaxID=1580 RepID=UPI001D000E7B|nr:TetR/AcrR family transcriptional regulator C-terminal domain-containing protein [Levilactobacillus brevis]MCB5233350.1 TetR/AcrR family transcriptional regulator C-terminal domain-containing protein [Levilactobacillus brevis]
MESRTKERLGATLQRLTDDEQFDTITVKRLVLESHVNRQTFYYHFQDKFDCLQYQFDHEAQRLVGKVTADNWLASYLSLFRYIDAHQNFCHHVVDSHAYSEFDDFILETIDLIVERLKQSLKQACPQLHFRNESGLLLFENGLQGIVRNWFRSGLRENPALVVEGIGPVSQRQLAMLLETESLLTKVSVKQQLASV